jgi:hypothetical protein
MWIPASKTLAGWAVIGVSVAAAAYFGVPEQRSVPGPVASSPAAATPPVAAPSRGSLAELLANAPRAPLPRKLAGDPFAGHASAPVTQVQAAPIPAKPVVPPFPFKYAGWLREGGGSAKIYLERGPTVFPIKVGDVLEGFRIDAIYDERIDVTFLAAGQQSSIMFASLTGGVDAATAFAGTAGVAGIQTSLQPAATQGSSASAVAAAAPPQAVAFPSGVARAPGPTAAAAPMTSRSAGLIPQAISAAQNAPSSGSMPTGPAPELASSAGSTPGGRLGVEPAASGRLGSEAVRSGGKLGL